MKGDERLILVVSVLLVLILTAMFGYDRYQKHHLKKNGAYTWASITNVNNVKSTPRGSGGLYTIYYEFLWDGYRYTGHSSFHPSVSDQFEHKGLGIGGMVLVQFDRDDPRINHAVRKSKNGIERPDID